MKKLLFFSMLFILMSSEIRAQNWFSAEHRWVFNVSGGFAGVDFNMEMLAESDTIIQGHPSRKWVFHSNGLFQFQPKFTYSDGPKAYYFETQLDSFVKIYDFSLPVGAIVEIPRDLGSFNYKIESIDTVQAGNLTLKRQRVNYLFPNGPSGWHFDILENAGMVGSPFDTMHLDDCAFVLIPDYQCSSVVDGIDIKFRCFSTPTGSFNPFSSSCTVLETKAPEENTFQMRPNPAADYLDIEVSSNNTALQSVSLTDLSGKKLRNWESVEAHYSLQGLPVGIYFVEVIFSNGVRTVKQLVKL